MFLSLLFACSACVSCVELPLDKSEEQQPSNEPAEDSPPLDTADDTAENFDPPPCPVMEIEPNGTYDDAQYIPMETWFCGEFSEPVDLDVFEFDFPEEGWLKVWIRAQDLGSTADTLVSIKNGSNTALSTFYGESTDPVLIVPVKEGMTISAAIQEQYNGFGENHFWEALFTQVKPPIEYNMTETDASNNGMADGQYVESEDRVFGIIENNYDRDWYLLELPEGTHKMTLSIEANQFGSPIDAMIYLYPPEALIDPETSYTKYRNHGLNPNSTDPYLTYTTDKAGTWGIQIKTFNNSGSDFYWYVLDVQVELQE